MSTSNHRADGRPRPDDEPVLCAHLEPGEEGTTCTIYPADVSAEEWTTAWLSADAGSYVALAEMR